VVAPPQQDVQGEEGKEAHAVPATCFWTHLRIGSSNDSKACSNRPHLRS
jgi:hypothetical protein